MYVEVCWSCSLTHNSSALTKDMQQASTFSTLPLGSCRTYAYLLYWEAQARRHILYRTQRAGIQGFG